MASRSNRRTNRSPTRPLCPTSGKTPRQSMVPAKTRARLPDVRPLRAGHFFGLTANPKPCGAGSIVTLDADEGRHVVAAGGRLKALAGSVHIKSSVAYEEYVGSPRFSGNGAELTARSTWRVNWSDIESLYLILFPGPIAGVPQLPLLMPNSVVLRAENVDFEAEFDEALIVANDGNNHYDKAKVTIQWKTIPFNQENPSTDQILTRRISVSGEFMTIPGWGCQWEDEDNELSSGSAAGGSSVSVVNEDVQAGKVLPIIEHHLTLHRVPSVPYALIRSLIGHVNETEFEGAEPETVMFGGAELQQTITSDGSQPWQIEMHFLEKIIRQNGEALGWNHAFDTKTGSWRRLIQKNGDDVYPLGDMNAFL